MPAENCDKCCPICGGNEELKACSACGLIYYCSVEHQKSHWKVHKGNCKAYKISSNESLGRFLEATRDLKAGSLIFNEFPLVIGPDWSYDLINDASTLNCVGCFVPIRMLSHRCPLCKWPCCSPDCIGLHNAKLHDIECAFLKGGLGPKHDGDYSAIRDYYRTDVLFALKCLLLQIREPKKFEQLMQLEGNVDERKATENFIESEKQISYLEENYLKPLRDAEKKANRILLAFKDRKTLQKIHGIIETNSSYITSNNEIAGLFATGAIIEHSCLPNCHFTFDKKNGFKLTVRAAHDIAKGEHITTCYSNITWGTQQRQQQLHSMKYFRCTCRRCTDPIELGTHFSSLKCLGIDDGAKCDGIQVPSNSHGEWTCTQCPARISAGEIEDLMSRVEDEIDNTMQKAATVPDIEALIEKLFLLLHPNHYHIFTLKHTLIQLYGNHRDFSMETITVDALKRKLHFCDDLLQIVERLDPHNVRLSIYTAVILYEKFNAIAEMHKRQLVEIPCTIDDARKCLERAQKILINELDTTQGKHLEAKIAEAIRKNSS